MASDPPPAPGQSVLNDKMFEIVWYKWFLDLCDEVNTISGGGPLRDKLITLRQGTEAEWTSANPTLASGEFGWETDTNKAKIGDGTTAWTSLNYITEWGSGGGGGGYSQEEIEDFVGAMFSGNTETLITASYQDADGTIDLVVDDDLSNYDNSTSGFITGYTVTEGDVTAHEAALTITESQISDLGSYITASSVATFTNKSGAISQWTNDSGYITGYTVTEGDVTAHQAALSITESQISDLGSYVLNSEIDADIKTLSLPASTTISTFGASLIDDASASAARTTLDVDQAGTDNSPTSAPAAYTYSGSHNITTTVSTIPFDTEEFDPDSNYANSSGEITATLAGYYHVSINIPVNDDGTSGATRGRVFIVLQRDQGTSTWVDVDNIRGQDYHRESSGGSGVHASGIVQLSASEVIRVRIDVSSSTDVSTESGQASINIHRVRE